MDLDFNCDHHQRKVLLCSHWQFLLQRPQRFSRLAHRFQQPQALGQQFLVFVQTIPVHKDEESFITLLLSSQISCLVHVLVFPDAYLNTIVPINNTVRNEQLARARYFSEVFKKAVGHFVVTTNMDSSRG